MTKLPAPRVEHPHVSVDESTGVPFVRGSRVPVRRLWAWFQRGVPVDTLVKRYPQLGASRVLSALAFAHDNADLMAADLARERTLLDVEPQISGAMVQAPLFPKR